MQSQVMQKSSESLDQTESKVSGAHSGNMNNPRKGAENLLARQVNDVEQGR